MPTPTSILFVCLGNICRSPQAEGVFRHLVEQAGRTADFRIDSAGTGDWHLGELPDPRTRACSASHGVALTHRSRQLRPSDFVEFDHLLVMDRQNLRDVLAQAPDEAARAKVRLFREHDPEGPGEVPDPYTGGPEGFEGVYRMCERTGRALLSTLLAA